MTQGRAKREGDGNQRLLPSRFARPFSLLILVDRTYGRCMLFADRPLSYFGRNGPCSAVEQPTCRGKCCMRSSSGRHTIYSKGREGRLKVRCTTKSWLGPARSLSACLSHQSLGMTLGLRFCRGAVAVLTTIRRCRLTATTMRQLTVLRPDYSETQKVRQVVVGRRFCGVDS